ncbi:hypothetical protein KBA73_00420 [Patescibacteria group bacterium]|nr:hypothetical protein [Patescibacteria group bacterium]
MSDHLSHELGTEKQEVDPKSVLLPVARERLDWILDKKAWQDFGMSRWYDHFDEKGFPPGFGWAVYVFPYEERGSKRLGVKIFNSTGLYDQSEYETFEDVPLSDREQQALIDEELRERYLAEKARLTLELKRKEGEIADNRGFPAGAYDLVATFPTSKGEKTRIYAGSFDGLKVEPLDTKEDVLRKLRGHLSMLGLHNDGMVANERLALPQAKPWYDGSIARVHVDLKNKEGVVIPYDFLMINGGHFAD